MRNVISMAHVALVFLCLGVAQAEEKIEIIQRRTQILKDELSELRHQCEELENYASH